MKKIFVLAAVAALFTTAACNYEHNEEPTENPTVLVSPVDAYPTVTETVAPD